MDNNELISVFVPVYNTEKYVRETLDSLVNQTYKNIEILVIDDGSTDSSPAICDEYLADNRVKVFHRQNAGLAASRQFGLDNSNGTYFATVDSDDYVSYDYVEKLYDSIQQYGADIAVCGVSCFQNETGKITQVYMPVFSDEKIILNKERLASDYQKISRDIILTDSWNKLYRIDFVRDANVKFTLKREYCCGQDLQFNYELALHCPIYCTCNESLLFHRNTPNSLMHKKEKKLQESLEVITESLIEECKKNDINLKKQLASIYYEFIGMEVLDIHRYGGNVAEKYRRFREMILKKRDFSEKHSEDLDIKGLKTFYFSNYALPIFILNSPLLLIAFLSVYNILQKIKISLINLKANAKRKK